MSLPTHQQKHIEAWQTSGLSQVAYCRQHQSNIWVSFIFLCLSGRCWNVGLDNYLYVTPICMSTQPHHNLTKLCGKHFVVLESGFVILDESDKLNVPSSVVRLHVKFTFVTPYLIRY